MTDGACANCGATLQPGDRYCGGCGTPSTAVVSAFSTVSDADPASASDAQKPPVGTPNPIAVAQMPTVPPPVGAVGSSSRERPRRGRLLVGLVVLVAVAAVAFLGVVLVSTRDDLESSQARVAQLRAAAGPTTTTEPTADPVGPLQAQIEQLNTALTQLQTELDAERANRATDSSTAAAAAVTAEQVQAQLTALQALFPVTEAAFDAADPTGSYTVALTAGECTLADCTALTSLAVTFSDATTIAGDRVNDTATTNAGDLTFSGTLAPALAPQCAGASAPSSYELVLHVTGVTAVDGALHATALSGTYTETISSGDCTGQHRAYTAALARQ